MRIRTFAAVLTIFCGCLAHDAAAAQGACLKTDTVGECWARYLPDDSNGAAPVDLTVVAKDEAKVSSDAVRELKGLETGLTGGAGPLATTTRDLLPLLTLTGLISDSDGNEEDDLLTVDLNFLIRPLAQDKNAQLKAVLNKSPKLFAPLAEAFASATTGAERIEQLQDGLDAGDDLVASITYSHINDRFGRSFRHYQRDFSILFEAGISKAMATREEPESDPLANALRVIGKRFQFLEDTNSVLENDEARALFENTARAEAKVEQHVRAVVSQYRLKEFARLVSNQPQLTLSAEVRERDALVGPAERSLKIGYEHGFVNVNDFRKQSGTACADFARAAFEVNAAEPCLNAYSSYVERNATVLNNADRVSAELAYVDIDDYSFSSPDDGVTVAREGSSRLDISLGYGRTLQMLGEERDSRVDLVAKYEDYSDDPDRRDRMVATLTLTTQIRGVSVPLALVYANHGQFLPEVDEELSAHIGIKFALDSQEEN